MTLCKINHCCTITPGFAIQKEQGVPGRTILVPCHPFALFDILKSNKKITARKKIISNWFVARFSLTYLPIFKYIHSNLIHLWVYYTRRYCSYPAINGIFLLLQRAQGSIPPHPIPKRQNPDKARAKNTARELQLTQECPPGHHLVSQPFPLATAGTASSCSYFFSHFAAPAGATGSLAWGYFSVQRALGARKALAPQFFNFS